MSEWLKTTMEDLRKSTMNPLASEAHANILGLPRYSSKQAQKQVNFAPEKTVDVQSSRKPNVDYIAESARLIQNIKSEMTGDRRESDVEETKRLSQQMEVMKQVALMIKQLKGDKKHIEMGRDALEFELKAKIQENESLRSSLESISAQYAQEAGQGDATKAMNTTIAAYKRDIAFKDNQIHRLREENERFIESEKQWNLNANEMDMAAKRESAQLKAELKEKDMELQTIMSSLGGNVSVMEGTANQNAELKLEVSAFAEQTKALMAHVEKLQKEKEDLIAANRGVTASEKRLSVTLENERRNFKNMVASLKKDNAMKGRTTSMSSEQLSQIHEEQVKLQEKLKEKDKEIKDDLEMIRRLEDENQMLVDIQSEMEAKAAQDKATMQAEMSRKDMKFKRLRASLSESLNSSAGSKDKEMAKLMEQNIELEEAITGSKALVMELQSDVAIVRREKDDALHRQGMLIRDHMRELDDLRADKHQLTESEKRLSVKLENERQSLNDKLKSVRAENEATVQNLQNEHRQSFEARKQMENEKNKQFLELERSQRELQFVQMDLMEKTKQSQSLRDTLAALKLEKNEKEGELVQEKQASQRKLDELRKQLATLKESYNAQANGVQQFHQMASKLKEENRKLTIEKEMIKSELERNEMKLQRAVSSLNGNLSAMQDSEAENRKLTEQIVEFGQLVPALKKRADEFQAEVHKVRGERDHAEHQQKMKDNTIQNQMAEIEKLKARNDELSEAGKRALNSSANEHRNLNETIASLRKDNDAKARMLQQQKVYVDDANEKLVQLRKQLDDREKEQRDIQDIIHKLQDEVRRLSASQSETDSKAKRDIDRMQSEINAKKMELERVVTSLNGSLKAMENVEAENTRLTEQLTAIHKHVADANRESTTLKSDMQTLQREKDEALHREETLQSVIRDQNGEINNLKMETRRLQELQQQMRSNLESERRNLQFKIESLTKDDEAKFRSLQQEIASKDQMKREISQLRASLGNKELKLRGSEESVRLLQNDNKQLLDARAQQQSELNAVQASLDRKDMECESLRTSLNDNLRALQHVQGQMKELSQKENKQEMTIENMKQEAREVTVKIEKLRSEKDDVQHQHDKSQVSNRDQQREIEDLRAQIRRLGESEKRIENSLENERRNFLEMVSELRKQNENKEDKLQQHIGEIDKLNREMVHLKQQLQHEAKRAEGTAEKMDEMVQARTQMDLEIDRQISKMKDNQSAIERELKAKTDECRSLMNELDVVKREKGHQSESLRKELDREKDNAQSLQRKMTEINEAMLSMKRNQDSNERTLHQQKITAEQLNREIAALRENVRQKENEARDVSAKLCRVEDENRRMVQDRTLSVQEKTKQIVSLEQSKKAVESKMESIQSVLDSKTKECQDLRSSMSENVKLLERAEEEIEELTQRGDQLKTTMADLKRQSMAEIQKVRRESANAVRLQREDRLQEIEHLKKKNDDLTKSKENITKSLEEERGNLNEMIERLRKEMESKYRMHKAAEDKWNADISQLEQKVKHKDEATQHDAETIHRLREENRRLLGGTTAVLEMERLRKEKDEAREMIRMMEIEIRQMNEEQMSLLDQKIRSQDHECEIKRLMAENTRLATEVKSSRDLLDNVRETMRRNPRPTMSEELRQLKGTLAYDDDRSAKGKISNLQDSRDRLEQELNRMADQSRGLQMSQAIRPTATFPCSDQVSQPTPRFFNAKKGRVMTSTQQLTEAARATYTPSISTGGDNVSRFQNMSLESTFQENHSLSLLGSKYDTKPFLCGRQDFLHQDNQCLNLPGSEYKSDGEQNLLSRKLDKSERPLQDCLGGKYRNLSLLRNVKM